MAKISKSKVPVVKYVWVVTVSSESGDDYEPWVFDKKPSDKVLRDKVKSIPGDGDTEEGPGAFGSYLHLSEPKKRPIK